MVVTNTKGLQRSLGEMTSMFQQTVLETSVRFEAAVHSTNTLLVQFHFDHDAHLNTQAPNSYSVQFSKGIRGNETEKSTFPEDHGIKIDFEFTGEEEQESFIVVNVDLFICNQDMACTMKSSRMIFPVRRGSEHGVTKTEHIKIIF